MRSLGRVPVLSLATRALLGTFAFSAGAPPLAAQSAPPPTRATAGSTVPASGLARPAARAGAPAAASSVTLTVAIVAEDLSIKPVPLHAFTLTPESGGTSIEARTGLDGRATVVVPAGRYTVSSASAVTLAGTSYQWNLPLDASGATTLELTNANATVRAATPVRARQMAPEMEVYRQVRTGVFRIQAGLGHGSGFLVAEDGFILTNAHVVAGYTDASAVLDSATRIPVQIVHRDNDADIAVLRAAPEAVRGRPVLPLSQTSPLVEPGERVFAIGYPLNQDQTLTSGIASSLREGAVISDVNINHGNSGGPLLNLAGEVVAINTFGDFTNQGGPGVSGSVVITRAAQPLADARAKAVALPPPSAERFPLMPGGRFRTADLKAFADSVKLLRYAKFDSMSVGKFYVTLTTPPIQYVRLRAFEEIVAKDRKKREERAGMDEEARYSELRDYRDWAEYVGDQRAPVVAIAIEPKVGETSGSIFRRLLLTGAGGKATMRYSGDLRGASIFRNGEPVTLLTGGTTPVKVFVDNGWVSMKDVADYGYYVLPAETFQPDADGTPPSIVVELDDLKNPTFPSCREIPRDVVATAWNDFVLYYSARGESFVQADAKKKPEGVPDKKAVCAAARRARNAPPEDQHVP